MHDNDNGEQEQSGSQPPEYVSSAPEAEDTTQDGLGAVGLGSQGPDPQAQDPQAPGPQGPGSEGTTRPFGQPGYGGQPGYAQPGYAQPGPEQPGYGQQGQPGYGQQGFGQSGYGQPGFGAAQGYTQPWGFGYGTPPPPPRRGSRVGKVLAYVAVAVVAAGAGAGAAVGLSGSSSNNSASSGVGSGGQSGSGSDPFGSGSGSGSTGGGSSSGGSLNTQSLSNKVDPGVVDVTSQLKYEQATAEGTGMVMTSSGLVLTNNHVIDEATSITATLVESGKTYTAKVVGYDSTDDVAVLQLVGASGLKTVSFGNSSAVKEGDSVLALGNAGGRGGLPSTAQGAIDGIGQTIQASDAGANDTETLHNMLETDAPIQEGDSGGPLVNASGQVIGMDTAANTSSGEGDGSGDGSGGSGLPGTGSGTGGTGGTGGSGTGDGGSGSSSAAAGFAIPDNTALSIAKQIESGKATGSVHIGLAGFMGISVSDPSQGCGSSSGSSGSGSGSSGSGGESGGTPPTSSGALVCSTISGTPAASSGLTAGDVITSVDGHSVTSEASLTNLTATSHPGDQLTVGYVAEDGSKHTTKFALAEWAK